MRVPWPLVFGLGLASCSLFADEEVEPAPTADVASSRPPSVAETPTPPDTWTPDLRAALGRAVVQPEANDRTYRVDPFVAALLFERLARTGGAPWLEPFTSKAADGTPKSGYRVLALDEDALLFALGLREGDIVEALNGVLLTGPDRIGFALDGAENQVTVMVFREDYSATMSYRLTGGLAWRSVLTGYVGEEDPALPGERAPEADATGPVAVASKPASGAGETPRPKGPAKSLPRGAGASPRPGSGAATSSGPIRCASSTHCTIEKATYERLVASPKKLQSQVKVVPAIRNNVHSGYKLVSIKRGSPAAKLGFRAGDKITHVNGRDLTDDMQALQLYWSLGSTRLFKVRYQRGNKKLVKTIAVG